jgi:hypothetical protein
MANVMLERLLKLIEEIEDLDPQTDPEAYVRRELLRRLDESREMLAALVAGKD